MTRQFALALLFIAITLGVICCSTEDDSTEDDSTEDTSNECGDTKMEPNETKDAAQQAPTADEDGFQICQGDNDWFKFNTVDSNKILMIGANSNHASGDLLVELVDANDEVYDDSSNRPDHYHEENAVGPTNLELHSLLGAANSQEWWLHITGVSDSVNDYSFVYITVDYQDGPVCTEHYSADEYTATNSQGDHDPSKLIIFPMGNQNDSYVGDNLFFKNGLYAFGNDEFTPTARLWARRELIMAVRHAVHSVQEAFPGTAPISICDIGLADGTTPQGHPNGTHYSGANIDISYYIKPEALGEDGNLVYRQICCDAPLFDWNCVDTDTSSTHYGTCVEGSETTHIVDIERNAMLIAKLAGTGRLRIIGVEAKIEAELETAMDQLATEGLITSSERDIGKSKMYTANDHSSWIWHFNHMHASFVKEPEATSTATSEFTDQSNGFQGPWLNLSADEQAKRARAFRPTPLKNR